MKTKIATVIAMAMLSAPVMAQQNLNSLDSQPSIRQSKYQGSGIISN